MNPVFWTAGTMPLHKVEGRLDQMRRRLRRSQKSRSNDRRELQEEVDSLRRDLEFVTLTLTSVLTALDDRQALSREDVREVMVEVDDYDGSLDGRLPVMALEELMRPPVLEEITDED